MTSMANPVNRTAAERPTPAADCVVGDAPEPAARVVGRVMREPVGSAEQALGCVMRAAPDPAGRTRGIRLFYTSDAAVDTLCVQPGRRLTIKTKTLVSTRLID